MRKVLLRLMLVLSIAGFSLPAYAQTACDDAADYLSEGQTYAAAGAYEDAVDAFTCAIITNPDDSEAYLGRLAPALLTGDYLMAIADLNTAFTLLGDDAMNLIPNLIEDYTTQAEANPDSIDPLIVRALLYQFDGNREAASADYDAILKADFENSYAWMFRAINEYEVGTDTPDQLTPDFERALSLDPANPAAYALAAIFYFGEGDSATGMDYLNQAIELDPAYPYAYYQRATFEVTQGNIEEALADYAAALEAGYQPASIILLERAALNESLADFEAAIDDYTALIELYPDNAEYLRSRANAYVALADFANVLADYDRIIELEPDNSDNFLTRGTYRLLTDDMAGGADDFLRYIQMIETDVVDMGAVEIGDSVTIDMAYGRTHTFTLEAEEGQQIDISAVSPDRLVDPLIVILDEDGVPLFVNDDVDAAAQDFNAGVEDFEIPADGTYTIVISHAAAGSEGEVEVSVDEAGGGADL